MFGWKQSTIPDIDTDQRWLVRPTKRTINRGRISPDYRPLNDMVTDIVIGEVSNTGNYFLLKDSTGYRGWYAVDDFTWLEQLV